MMGQALGWNDQTPWIDKAQDVVSLIGVVDPTGIADVANALVYGARGKFGDAAISLAGVVPLAGDSLKLTKFARGTAVAAKEGKAVARTAHVGAAAAKADVKVVGNARRAARQGSSVERLKQTAQVKVRRAAGRQLRSAEKIATGTGKVRGKVGEVYEKGKKYKKEFDRRFGDRNKEEPEAPDQATDTPDADQAEAPAQDVPPPKSAGRLARKTIDDEKPEQPPPPERAPLKMAGAKPVDASKSDDSEETAGPESGGGASKTPEAGKPMVPVDGKCPGEQTKTSTWGAKPGFKRCHGQTQGREH
jgi:hypothetical protein